MAIVKDSSRLEAFQPVTVSLCWIGRPHHVLIWFSYAGSINNIDDTEYKCLDGTVPDVRNKVISGVVGASSSGTSIQVANLLRLFKIPQVYKNRSWWTSRQLKIIHTLFLGFLLLVESRAEQQAALWIFHADNSIWPPPGDGHRPDDPLPQMVLHFHPLRGIHLRHQGNKLVIFFTLDFWVR
jgi:hypothetical protein